MLVPLGLALLLPGVSLGATDSDVAPRLDAIRLGPEGVLGTLASGETTPLTLDPALQRSAMRLLSSARPSSGAIVAVDPRAGRLLAWAGFRAGAPSGAAVSEMLAPAASLFKIVTTAALLEKHVSPDRTVCVEGGSSRIAIEQLTAPRTGRALCAPFRDALGRSRNAVFAQLAARFLSRDDLTATAERFGFNRDAPLDVRAPIGSFEAPEGELALARSAAGFIGSRLSPIGAAYLATTVARLGRPSELRILDRIPDEGAKEAAEPLARAMEETTARELRHMMEATIHSGTSREAFTDPDGHAYLGDVRAAGKTGTLQPDRDGPTTSWFVGFAPSRSPRLAISVLLENGAGWRRKANEVGRDVFRSYFAARGYRGVTAPDGI